MSAFFRNIISKIKYANRMLIENNKRSEELLSVVSKNIVEKDLKIQALESQLMEVKQQLGMLSNQLRSNDRFFRLGEENFLYSNLEYLQMQQQSEYKILLVGFYGAINLGDDLMMRKIYGDLCGKQKNTYVMLCDNEDLEVFRYVPMRIIHYPKTKFDYSWLANAFDCVIFGGGAIIDDAECMKNESFRYDMGKIYIELSTAFVKARKAVYTIGVSTSSELTNEDYIRKLKYVIENGTYFSVRDKYSAALLEKLTGYKPNVVNDIVQTYPLPEIKKYGNWKQKTIGIIWICQESIMTELIELISKIREVYKEEKYEIKLIPFYNYRDCDEKFYEDVLKHIDNKHIFIESMSYDFMTIYQKLSECDLIISMRYHGALIGLMTRRKTISLLLKEHRHYYNKMKNLFEMYGCENELFLEFEDLMEEICSKNLRSNAKEVVFDNTEYDCIMETIRKLGE